MLEAWVVDLAQEVQVQFLVYEAFPIAQVALWLMLREISQLLMCHQRVLKEKLENMKEVKLVL